VQLVNVWLLKNQDSKMQRIACAGLMIAFVSATMPLAEATTKGLSQIVTPDLQPEGDLSLSFQIQDKRIANPYQLQAELGLTEWAEVAVFRGFQPESRRHSRGLLRFCSRHEWPRRIPCDVLRNNRPR
jgi:hypothetical protein